MDRLFTFLSRVINKFVEIVMRLCLKLVGFSFSFEQCGCYGHALNNNIFKRPYKYQRALITVCSVFYLLLQHQGFKSLD